jgi:hypothetical protein
MKPNVHVGRLTLLLIAISILLGYCLSAYAGLPLPPQPPERPSYAETMSILVIWDTDNNPVAYIIPSKGYEIYAYPGGEYVGYFTIFTNVPEERGKNE